MTSTTPVWQRPRTVVVWPERVERIQVPWGAAVAVAALVIGRLLYLHEHLRPDEGGYLAVGAQWHSGGSSLYGNYWVDRPPLLITIFAFAARLGGAVPLRLIGLGAAVVTTVAIAWVAQRLAGRRAATWSAIVAAAWLVSPLAGADEVNGELLAAPFLAVGFAAVVHTLTARSPQSAAAAGVAAGAAGAAAVLVKQNMVDVFVLAAVLGLLSMRRLGVRRIAHMAASFCAGALAMTAAVAVWTIGHGTSLRQVWFAMYRFRLEVGRMQLAGGLQPNDLARRHAMVDLVLLNGMALAAVLTVLVLGAFVKHDSSEGSTDLVRRHVPIALVVMLVYEVASIAAGRHFFSRYTLQTVVPLSVGVGLAAVRLPRLGRVVVTMSAVAAMVATLSASYPSTSNKLRAGEAIARVSHHGDSIATMNGYPALIYATGLPDPYPYLWMTPEVILDAHSRLLTATLDGPHAPTWFAASADVLRGAPPRLQRVLAMRYHHVTTLDDKRIYLHDGLSRAIPAPPRGGTVDLSHKGAS